MFITLRSNKKEEDSLQRPWRRYLLFSLLCLWLLAGSGCGQEEVNPASSETEQPPADSPVETVDLAAAYPLDSQQVTIYLGEVSPYQKVIITDPAEIAALTDCVKFDQWEKADPVRQLTGLNYYYVQFNENTTIGLYQETAYGDVGSGAPDANGNLERLEANYFMPAELLQMVEQLVAKYGGG